MGVVTAALAIALLAQDDVLKDLLSDDFAKRQVAVESIGRLDDKAKKALAEGVLKSAQDVARGADELRRKAADDLLSKRPDEKALKKKTQELRQISDKIAFPMTADGFKLQGELRTKLEELWRQQYPDLSNLMESDAIRPWMEKFSTMEQAAEKCGEKKVVAEIKKMREALAVDEHAQWKLLLPDAAVKTLLKNEEVFRKAKGDQAMQECEYRASVVMNMYRVLMGASAASLSPALSRECRKWSAFIDGGGKGGAYGVHSDSPNEDMCNGAADGSMAAWLLMASDREHIAAIFRWGSLGIGYHGRWWTWRG